MAVRAFFAAVLLFSITLNLSDNPTVGINRIHPDLPLMSMLAWGWFIWAFLWLCVSDFKGLSLRTMSLPKSVLNMLGCLVYVASFHVLLLWWWV